MGENVKENQLFMEEERKGPVTGSMTLGVPQ